MIAPANCGEIVHVGQVLEPTQAKSLGDTTLRLFAEHVARPTTPYTESEMLFFHASDLEESRLDMATKAAAIELSASDQEIIDAAHARFGEVLDERVGASGLLFDSELFVGTAGEGDWHFDGDRCFRLLVNLSKDPLKLLVATKWGDKDYEKWVMGYRIKREGPADFTEIEYKTGEGILLDNNCDPKQRVPHAGRRAKNKAFLRSYAVEPVT